MYYSNQEWGQLCTTVTKSGVNHVHALQWLHPFVFLLVLNIASLLNVIAHNCKLAPPSPGEMREQLQDTPAVRRM